MARPLLLQFLWLLLWLAAAAASASMSEPDCPEYCWEVGIPFPFGIGSGCSRDMFFNLTCDDSYSPPRPFWGQLQIQSISLEGQISVRTWIAMDCYNEAGRYLRTRSYVGLYESGPFSFSITRNKLVAIGCDTNALITGNWGLDFSSGCSTYCQNRDSVTNGMCSGIGCCQTSIPPGLKYFKVSIGSYKNHTGILDFNPCSYAFLVDQDQFNFSMSDLFNDSRYSINSTRIPTVVDWAAGNETCQSAKENMTTYACRSENSLCSVPTNSPGYRCHCDSGYQGNPYLLHGCEDIDECLTDTCGDGALCKNIMGSYECYCPNGTLVSATEACIIHTDSKLEEKIIIGVSVGISSLVIAIGWIYWILNKRRHSQLKEKFFKQNGGLLLQQHITSNEGVTMATKIFSAEELKRATNNYDESRIVGQGGYGTVYRGILSDDRTVAIKKSKIVDESQIEQFINEVSILSQINHRNVVKLLGCCLETEVPLLVYEFVSNGTLYHHIHDEAYSSSLSLDNRLRIASETAGALAYLHSEASLPIFHRDVKSTNILLDDSLTAKVSDFGASRLVPLDQTQLTTLVQGTLGYLDPEYFQTGQLTEKSDVYSFGVVLVEILTGEKPICLTRSQQERNLSMYFISSMKENRVFEILEDRVVDEGNAEQLLAVSELAKRCLKIKGEERPTMKDVAIELEGLRRLAQHSWIQKNHEETQCLLGQPSIVDGGCSSSSFPIEQDSMGNHSLSVELEMGR